MASLLVLGGARSGKSRYAEARAVETGLECVYVATAEAGDAEMRARIAHHRAGRGDGWLTVEAPLDLVGAIDAHAGAHRVVLVDCLTLWLSNRMLAQADVQSAVPDVVAAIGRASGPVILVSNEVGWGIVPDNALARRFRDAAGFANQHVAAAVDEVQLVCAGLPLPLKRPSTRQV